MNDWELSYRGLTVGADTAYALVSVEGLGMPAVRSADRARLLRPGQTPGTDTLDGRSIVVEVEVDAADAATLASLVEQLSTALRPGGDELPLTFRIPGIAAGGDRRVLARPRRLHAQVDRDRWFHRLPVVLAELHATDPRLYDAAESSGSTTLPSVEGGVTFPLTFNRLFGAVSTGGTITAVNAGSFPAPWVAKLDGPLSNPRVENVTTGQSWRLVLDIAAGDFVEVDSGARTVLLNGTASRYETLEQGSELFDLEPGPNELDFSAIVTETGTLTATWRSAWTT